MILKRRQTLSLFINKKIFSLLACGALLSAAAAQSSDTSAAREIAKIDRDYSNLSIEKGMPAASVEYFSEDGIAFAPKPVNGKKYWGRRKDFADVLIWQPILAAAARAADLGYTVGPWELKNKEGNRSLAYGHYLTLWSKKANETWKIALDVGVDNPQPTEPPGALEVLPADPTAGERAVTDARRSLQKAERVFLERARQDIGQAILAQAAADIWVLRDKSFPAKGVAGARLLLGSDHAKTTRQFGGSHLSSSGDLSYTYGTYSCERGNTQESGVYVMIWRINLNGDWKLHLDLQKPFPASEHS